MSVTSSHHSFICSIQSNWINTDHRKWHQFALNKNASSKDWRRNAINMRQLCSDALKNEKRQPVDVHQPLIFTLSHLTIKSAKDHLTSICISGNCGLCTAALLNNGLRFYFYRCSFSQVRDLRLRTSGFDFWTDSPVYYVWRCHRFRYIKQYSDFELRLQ